MKKPMVLAVAGSIGFGSTGGVTGIESSGGVGGAGSPGFFLHEKNTPTVKSKAIKRNDLIS